MARRGLQATPTKTIFLHTPKTAGTSFRDIVSDAYPQDQVLFIYSHEFLHDRRERQTLSERAARAEVLYGHISYGIHRKLGIEARYVTFLRDPVDRVVSFFRHQMRDPQAEFHLAIEEGLTLIDLLRTRDHQVTNHMTRIISGRGAIRAGRGAAALKTAIRNLDRDFCHVGVTEQMDASVQRIATKLDWPVRPTVPSLNIDPHSSDFMLDEETRVEIARYNSLDIALYEHVLERIADENVA